MKKRWLLIIILSAIIQMTVFKYFEIGGIIPNILLILALFLMIFYNFYKIWLFLFLIGLILDLFSDSLMGTNLFILMATSFVFHFFFKEFFNQKNLLSCLFLGILGLMIFYSFSLVIDLFFIKVNLKTIPDFKNSVLPFLFFSFIYNFVIYTSFIFGAGYFKLLSYAD